VGTITIEKLFVVKGKRMLKQVTIVQTTVAMEMASRFMLFYTSSVLWGHTVKIGTRWLLPLGKVEQVNLLD
jgi:hypothetical protein